jgi:hypothetical protein
MNVEPKYGGRYLPENKSFAMQTIAHNTVTVDMRSHFGGEMSVSERFHGDRHFFDARDKNCQVMSAKAASLYEGVTMQRTAMMVRDARFVKPVVVDIVRVLSEQKHTYDLPFYYMGHLISTNVKYRPFSEQLEPLGGTNGYQHLWKEAEGQGAGTVQVSWLAGERYYTVSSAADMSTRVAFVRIGASDPNFNLRHEPGFILRQHAASHVFASVIEPHGRWDGTREFSENARSAIRSVRVRLATEAATAVEIEGNDSWRWIVLVNNGTASDSVVSSVVIDGARYDWKGNTHIVKQ